ncbi:MAG: VOC family protein, partial [Gemmatimonadota bacterium]|nr:VOC family protein [Gemmatimonadota bacterium]
HDLERATAFYRDRLGMKFLFAAPPRLAFFDAGGTRLMLDAAAEPGFDHPGSILYFDVPDVREAHTTLRARGVEFVDQPHVVAPMPNGDLWMTFFRDPDGNTMALMSVLPRG